MANKWNNLKRKMSPQAQARVDARVKATLQTMPLADRIILTLVHGKPPGDTYLPAIDPELWREAERLPQPRGPDDEYGFTVINYERAGAS